jgi:hypothetical protein
MGFKEVLNRALNNIKGTEIDFKHEKVKFKMDDGGLNLDIKRNVRDNSIKHKVEKENQKLLGNGKEGKE